MPLSLGCKLHALSITALFANSSVAHKGQMGSEEGKERSRRRSRSPSSDSDSSEWQQAHWTGSGQQHLLHQQQHAHCPQHMQVQNGSTKSLRRSTSISTRASTRRCESC